MESHFTVGPGDGLSVGVKAARAGAIHPGPQTWGRRGRGGGILFCSLLLVDDLTDWHLDRERFGGKWSFGNLGTEESLRRAKAEGGDREGRRCLSDPKIKTGPHSRCPALTPALYSSPLAAVLRLPDSKS